ncbi:MAG: hypothetical protein O4861_17895 [Trichodesmium sp. St16_bin4-tuft]|uniref:Uncharacterized protein n=1 Tax=Trichodesmium erythraeum (strain IMS101) TaxID=203124 RepID=Q111H9_TRIEI|nr:hypothetical protein [Trichodesmium erythraeum GBRTRLIN201]MDE5078365.1 hypothetical protein [Trichodesmium sp. St2_bin6]MDE5094641.1 hypothetical protein [Trichodesmium sp. St11_bin5]MDE5100102.1 hypothetical protein [Trichodesmium sp. St16_bin4-tuft]MDE5104715.1 hypothetical protein [Trichodesmium sp. St19_bin2]MDT9341584.1 hypothetical protein [Trichodesmium erythraeum 21-75]
MSVSELYYFSYSTKPKNTGWSFCLRWVFFTLIGFLVSLMFVEVDVKPYVGAISGAMGGAVVGLAQWLVLRNRIFQSRWWVVVSIVAWLLIGASSLGALGWIAPRTEQIWLRLFYGVINGAIMGGILGLAQWFVVKRQISRPQRWIMANILAWAIGLPLGWLVGGLIYEAIGLFISEVIGLFVTWFFVALITGIALMR